MPERGRRRSSRLARLDRFIALDEQRGVLALRGGRHARRDPRARRAAGLVPPGRPRHEVRHASAARSRTTSTARTTTAPGTFGAHVPRLELLRSTGERARRARRERTRSCSRRPSAGWGSPGSSSRATIQLRRDAAPRSSPQRDGPAARASTTSSSVAADVRRGERVHGRVGRLPRARRRSWGAGSSTAGNCAAQGRARAAAAGAPARARGPVRAALLAAQPRSRSRAFNAVYYAKNRRGRGARRTRPLRPVLLPARRRATRWNRIYGRRGFPQFQCVVPEAGRARRDARAPRAHRSRSGEGSFLAVLKNFGAVPSPGLLSFPRDGRHARARLPEPRRANARALRGARRDGDARDGRRALPGEGRAHARRAVPGAATRTCCAEFLRAARSGASPRRSVPAGHARVRDGAIEKVAIFGATSAMAQETVRLLAARGAELFLVGRDRPKLEAVVADARRARRDAGGGGERGPDDAARHAALLEQARGGARAHRRRARRARRARPERRAASATRASPRASSPRTSSRPPSLLDAAAQPARRAGHGHARRHLLRRGRSRPPVELRLRRVEGRALNCSSPGCATACPAGSRS